MLQKLLIFAIYDDVINIKNVINKMSVKYLRQLLFEYHYKSIGLLNKKAIID